MLAAIVVALSLPGAPAAQCGPDGGWVAATAGVARHAVADGLRATEAGLEGGIGGRRVSVTGAYRRVMPGTGRADVDVLEVRVAVPLVEAWGIRACAVGLGAVTRFASAADRGTTAGGGVGLRLEAPVGAGPVRVFLEGRGLAAAFSGAVVGEDLDARGLALGAEGGVEARGGRLVLRLAGSVHGFAGGLGVTGYPERAARLAVGYRL